MEYMVPLGILSAGFLRSPDMLAPTAMPVTAGKKTAKTVQKLFPSVYPEVRMGSVMVDHPPLKNETMEAARTIKMAFCTLKAKSAPTQAITAKIKATIVDTILASNCG